MTMNIKGITFETWCQNHTETHDAKWCRELYPWPVFASLEYGSEYTGKPQEVRFQGLRYVARLVNAFIGKNGRLNYLIRLRTEPLTRKAEWEERQWDDLFHLVASPDGHFITLYTEERDPSKVILASFMRGDFSDVEAIRSKPVSAMLFRSLVSYRAEELFGPLEHHRTFDWQPGGVRTLPDHPQFAGHPISLAPLRSRGRELWITHAFREDKAHRFAFYNAAQCQHLLVVYCLPTFSKHHRCAYPDTQVLPLLSFVQSSSRGPSQFLPHVRVLMNHLRYSQVPRKCEPSDQLLARIRQYDGPPMEIVTSYLREAKAGLDMDVTNSGEAAYFFACANLLNAALTHRYGRSVEVDRLAKEVYSFKERVGHVIGQLIENPRDGVSIYVAQDGLTYVEVSGVQFSFHAVPRTPTVIAYMSSSQNIPQDWSGRRLQPIAPLVLDWGRARMVDLSY